MLITLLIDEKDAWRKQKKLHNVSHNDITVI